MKEEINVYFPKIEDFDYLIYEWIDKDLNIFCNTQTGWRKVPIVFSTPEEYVLSKQDIDTRDENGTLNYPVISIEKKTIKKPNAHDGNMAVNLFPSPGGGYKDGTISIAKKISQFTNSKFQNKNSYNATGQINRKKESDKNVYQIISIPQPSLIEISYEITAVSNFHQQINEIISPFITKYKNINYFSKIRNEWSYECFIEENFPLENNVNDFTDEERMFKSKMGIVVKGYILENNNIDKATVTINETPVEFKMKKEYVIKGNIDEYIEKLNKDKKKF